MKILYTNARGIMGKMNSLNGIIVQTDPDIVAICETKLNTDRNVIVNGFKWIGRPREQKEDGGIGVLLKDEISKNTTIELIGDDNIEIMWLRIKLHMKKALILGIYYGKQESRTAKEQAETEIGEIQSQIRNFQNEDVELILLGDFNAKISDGHDSRNGKILRKEMIQEFELKIVNETVKCQGKYTRVNTAIEEEKSVIDYVIVNQSSYENVENMIIDEENNYKLSGKNLQTTAQ